MLPAIKVGCLRSSDVHECNAPSLVCSCLRDVVLSKVPSGVSAAYKQGWATKAGGRQTQGSCATLLLLLLPPAGDRCGAAAGICPYNVHHGRCPGWADVLAGVRIDSLGAFASRKLALSPNVRYYEKSKCDLPRAYYSFQDAIYKCEKGQIACCGPSNAKCYADATPGRVFKCKSGDAVDWCCNA